MSAKPGYIWDGSAWQPIGFQSMPPTAKVQSTAPTSPSTGDLWIDTSTEVPALDPSSLLYKDSNGNVNIDNNTFVIDGVNNRVGVGTGTPSSSLDVTGSINIAANNGNKVGYSVNDTFSSNSTTGAHYGMTFGVPANNRVSVSGWDGVHLWTGGASRLQVDGAGRILTPSQTAFNAKVTADTSYGIYADIVFGTVTYNIGSAYNSSNGRFTAPVSGLYHIYTMVRFSLTSSTYWHAWFKVNGNAISGSYGLIGLSSVSGSSFNASSTSFNVYLNAGDYITSAPWTGTYTVHEQSYFGGYLLG